MTYGGSSAGAPGSHLPAMRTLLRDAYGLERVVTTETLPPHGTQVSEAAAQMCESVRLVPVAVDDEHEEREASVPASAQRISR